MSLCVQARLRHAGLPGVPATGGGDAAGGLQLVEVWMRTTTKVLVRCPGCTGWASGREVAPSALHLSSGRSGFWILPWVHWASSREVAPSALRLSSGHSAASQVFGYCWEVDTLIARARPSHHSLPVLAYHGLIVSAGARGASRRLGGMADDHPAPRRRTTEGRRLTGGKEKEQQ